MGNCRDLLKGITMIMLTIMEVSIVMSIIGLIVTLVVTRAMLPLDIKPRLPIWRK